MNKDTLLIEIGTEELPPNAAKLLSDSFAQALSEQLDAAHFEYREVLPFVTPRRLSVQIKQLSAQQPQQQVARKGPAIKAAYDEHGQATKAALGFAKTCGVEMKDLQTQETEKGAWLYFESCVEGQFIDDMLQEFVEQSLKKLPVPRPMRWGASDTEFVRPIHWVCILYGSRVIPCTIKQHTANNFTYGHRFHSNGKISLAHADDYVNALKNAYVIADFATRQSVIKQQIEQCAQQHDARLHYPQSLLDEVTNLVEWPVAVVGEFSQKFLSIPKEVLVMTMQESQRYFPLFNAEDNSLLAYFITIANIESSRPETIKLGNERVIKPRFEDAEFFWERDRDIRLSDRSQDLNGILFEKQLGSIHEKSERVTQLATQLCTMLDINEQASVKAAQLCKNDLLTDMVNEFPKLQGTMGRYYASHDGENIEVCLAIEEHYLPLYSGGALPTTMAGKVVALCDRVDTLVGIFATGKKPTGVKDPYALRRAAIAIIRLSIEADLDFDLTQLLHSAGELLKPKLAVDTAVDEVFEYIMERMRAYYQDQAIEQDIFESVRAVRPTRLVDFNQRVQAVRTFLTLEESTSLASANKRIANILKKTHHQSHIAIDKGLFSQQAEKTLYQQITILENEIAPIFDAGQYSQALTTLAKLRPSIDRFFEEVMVMDDDIAVRDNRIALLHKVNQAFIATADISLIQS